MKADMLDSKTITLENAAGAVMTNCLFGAYAVGEIEDIESAINENLHIKMECEPDEENHEFYREQYKLKTRLVKEELSQAFLTLKQIRR